MKIAVLILVLANLVVFAWLRWARPGPPEPDLGMARPASGGVHLKILGSPTASGGVASAKGSRPRRCLTVGPMSAVAPAAALAAQLGEAGLVARTLVRAETVPGGYQVLLSGFADRASAEKAAARLGGGGVTNLSVAVDKQDRNIVYLGLYRSLDEARKRVVAIKKHGFEPQIRIRARTAPRWYLQLPASASAAAAIRKAGVAMRAGRCTAMGVEPGSAGAPASAASSGAVPAPASTTPPETAPSSTS